MRYRARCCYGCKWTQLLDSEEGMLEAERKHYEVCEKSPIRKQPKSNECQWCGYEPCMCDQQ